VEMSGLSSSEMEGCRNLLGLLDNDEIMALCDTVTNRLVQPEDRQDAVRAILVYSQSAEELLRRRKVHREVIFKYLATQGIVIPPATEKYNLIQHAKDYWQKQPQLKLKEMPEPVTKTEDIQLFQQQSGLELPTSGDPPALASQSAEITGVSHSANPPAFFFSFFFFP
uniref:Uncharacterized protein n=1 Tax=Piliocolobus tephrosceles TaxID=591936 RepID=A0A8C9HKY7_9PRIM